MSSEDCVQVPPDSTGKKLRALKKNVGGNDVYDEVVAVEDGSGNVIDPRVIRALTALDRLTITSARAKSVLLENGSFETADFQGWKGSIGVGRVSIDGTVWLPSSWDTHSCKIPNNDNFIEQYVPAAYGDEITIGWSDIAEHDNDVIVASVIYIDDTSDFDIIHCVSSWVTREYTPPSHKIVKSIMFSNVTYGNIGTIWLDDISVNYTQAVTVSNLLNPHPVAVQDLLRGLTDPAATKKVNEVDFTWNADGTVATAVYKDSGAVTLFTLTFSYATGNLTSIVRS